MDGIESAKAALFEAFAAVNKEYEEANNIRVEASEACERADTLCQSLSRRRNQLIESYRHLCGYAYGGVEVANEMLNRGVRP